MIRESNISHQQNKGRYLGKTDYAGIVICGKCGVSYQSCGTSHTKTKITRYFACRSKYRYDEENGIPKCDNPTVRQEDLDGILTSISYTFSRWNRVKRGLIELKKIKSSLESRIDRDNEIEIQEAQHQLRDTNLKKDKLLDLYLSDSFTKAQLDSRLKPLEDFAQELQEKIDMLSKTNEDIFREMKEVDEIIKVFEEENDKLQEEANNGSIASKYTRKELLKDIEAIVVGTDGSLTLNFKSLAIISQLTHKYRYLMEKVS